MFFDKKQLNLKDEEFKSLFRIVILLHVNSFFI